MKHKVLLTLRFPDALLERLRSISPDLEIVQNSLREGFDSRDTGSLMEGDEEVLYCFMPPRDLSLAPNLKWVQLHSAGINHLRDHPILGSNIRVTTCSGIHSIPIGEFSIAMMMALARRITRMTRYQERAEWPKDGWHIFLGTEMHGKTLGVIGYGSIGRETARIAKQGFGMRVLAMTRSGEKRDRGYHEPGVGDADGTMPDEWFAPGQLRELLAQSDYVLIALPLTRDTQHLIGEQELRAMKPSAYIINIARGGILDDAALIRALKEKWIAGAGLDVFPQEPLPAESELWKLENALISPHVSSATPQYDDRAVGLFAENLRRYLRGEPLLNLVNAEAGY